MSLIAKPRLLCYTQAVEMQDAMQIQLNVSAHYYYRNTKRLQMRLGPHWARHCADLIKDSPCPQRTLTLNRRDRQRVGEGNRGRH